MSASAKDARPRVLGWAGWALLFWAAGLTLLARVYWQGVLFAVVAQTLLMVGVVLGVSVVARRRDPAEPPPEPVAPVEPGAPRRRVPRLEASAGAVIFPTVFATTLAVGGLIYILPEVEFPDVWRWASTGMLVLGSVLALLIGRYANRRGASILEGAGLLAWARSVVAMAAIAVIAIWADASDIDGFADLGVWIPALSGISILEAVSLAQFVAVLLSCVEPLFHAVPGLWSWWNLRDAPAPTRLRAVDSAFITLFFSESNPVRSLFSVLERSFGIDIRSSWALAFLRQAFEPAVLGVVFLGWISTGLVMVEVHERAVRERFGRAVSTEVLGPGLHVVWPWPIERIRRVSTERVRTLTIGHEEEEELPADLLDALDPGDADDEDSEDALADARGEEQPESRLWAKLHADEEYTLLLGDGRDLVTIDGLVHYRVADPVAWLYGMQNPESALRSLAYRAVMERIIAQTLDEALGQDFAQLALEIEVRLQAEADVQQLGVEVVDVTLGALHPPVSVAEDYQAVVSAQITRETDRIGADAYRTGRLSEARRDAARDVASALARAAKRRAESVGEAEAFLGLRAQVRTAEANYRFRRRMDAMAANLGNRRVVVIDHRLERDGASIWLDAAKP
ncbi:MAG: hypothetical protein CL927_04015 [Deltaproteobacteria bacterium]|nr:hypothetical protein [Deltaproteobacteria bacterium]HCH64755.1 hypothetical protein [Deltaproteobacteria bacterium]